jgi:hypothetical protein
MPALSSFDARPFMQVADSFAIRSPVDEPTIRKSFAPIDHR